MWIRCQNRMMLIKDVSHINAIKEDGKYSIYEVTTECSYELGVYSTLEKSLKVLDEIQKKVEYPGSTLISPTSLKHYYCLSPTGQFYQMPQDDEVEV